MKRLSILVVGTLFLALAACGSAGSSDPEVCTNGTDDDGDGQVDCADSDCAAAPACTAANCGNGTVDTGEDCDGASLGGATCVSEGFPGGTLACALDCTFDTSGCAAATCGDGTIDAGEMCDGANLGGADCALLGYVGGTLGCGAGCDFDVSGCTAVELCANGVDDDADGFVDCADPDCGADPGCTALGELDCSNLSDEDGDGLLDCQDASACVDLGLCVPGATPTGQGCTSQLDCAANTTDPLCISEGTFGWPGGYCSEFCVLAANDCAGDAVCLDLGLPDGVSGLCFDGCATNADCRLGYACLSQGGTLACFEQATCGDGARTGSEACEGTDLGGNTCASIGYVGGMLACDAGCAFDTTGCTSVCGDGLVSPSEQCDDGNVVGGDGCSALCANETCLAPPAAVLGDNTGDTLGGTAGYEGNCTGGSGALEQVWTYTPTANGVLTLTLASATDQGVYVRTTCDDAASELACTDAQGGGVNEVLTLNVTAGVPLSIFVDGFFDAAYAGPYTLTLAFAAEVCGDGVIVGAEVCDGPALNGETCLSQGFASGTLSCSAFCDAFVTTACVASVCGDGVINGTEQCDGANLGGATCASLGFSGGTLSCAACAYNTTACTVSITETEPNNTSATADPYVNPFFGAISVAGDFDFVSVVATAGQTISAQVTDTGDGACLALTLDSDLAILGTDGTTQLAFNDDISGATNWCSSTSTTVAAAGTYFVRVRSSQMYAPMATFSYHLIVTLTP